MRCTGLSRRQFFYAKRRLEQHQFSQVVFQTTLKAIGRGWQIIASRRMPPVVGLASGHNESIAREGDGVLPPSDSPVDRLPGGMGGRAPVSAATRVGRGLFFTLENGRDRRCRANLTATTTPWTTGCNAFKGNPKGLQYLNPPWRDLEPSPGLMRLAHHLKRVLEGLHWDNCKVNYSAGMAFRYAESMLLRGFSYETICDGYETGLSAMHGTATDVGLLMGNPRLRFEASSTVNRARIYCKAKGRSFFCPPPGEGAKSSTGDGTKRPQLDQK